MKAITKVTAAIATLLVAGVAVLGYNHYSNIRNSKATTIGSVDTGFNLFTPNHKIVTEGFQDDLIPGVTCYISMSKRGGVSGVVRDTIGIQVTEEMNEKSIDCIKTVSTPITPSAEAKKARVMFKESRSFLFNDATVQFMYDGKTNTGVYQLYTDTLIEGVPKSSIAAVNFN